MSAEWSARRVVGWYAGAALAWFGSTLVMVWLMDAISPIDMVRHPAVWVFIATMGAALFVAFSFALRRQVQAHERLTDDRERYRQMVDAVADYAIVLLDADGRIATWNPGAERITGRPAGTMVGRAFECLCASSPDSTHDLERALAVAREKGMFSTECMLSREDGAHFWAAVHITPLRSRGGTITGFVNVTRDISAHKAAEAALGAHAEQYRLIFRSHPLPMWVYDLESLRIVTVNDAAIAHYGYSHSEFTAMTVRDIRPAEDLPQFLAAVEEVRAGRTVTPIARAKTWRHRRKDGSIIHVEITSHVIQFEGRPAELVLAHDVTARLKAELALEESRARLASIIESAMDAIITVAPDHRIVVFNHAAEAMFGPPAAEMLGEPFMRLLPERLRATSAGWFTGASLRLGAPEQFAGRREDGSEFPAEASIAPTTAAGGTHFTVVMRDITAVRDAERTVRRLSAHVLRLQDFERRRIARELHDTTAQNLAALNMNLAQLERAVGTAAPAHARLITETSALADLTVQQIRTLSYVLHPPLLDALGLCRAAQDYVQGFAARSGITTSSDIDEFLGRLSDEAEIALFRVLQESLGNVHRHSGATHAHVRLGLEGDDVELTITDYGHGMDSGTQERLRRRATVGVGIAGMTERLEQLGGTLQIISSDEGTTVRAAVPIENASRPGPAIRQDIHETL